MTMRRTIPPHHESYLTIQYTCTYSHKESAELSDVTPIHKKADP